MASKPKRVQETAMPTANINDTRGNRAMDYAEERHKAGVKPGYSTDICGQLTIGYGVLDDYGNWEFPLPARYWPVWALACNYAEKVKP